MQQGCLIHEHALLIYLGVKLPEVLFAEFGQKNLCLLATWIAVEVAAQLGMEMRPLPMKVFAFNRQVARSYQKLGHMPTLATIANPENKMWTVSIGCGYKDEDGWDGHLVAAGTRWMLDASVGQMSSRLLKF